MPYVVPELRADHAKIRELLEKISQKKTAFDDGQGDDFLVLYRNVHALANFLKYDHHPKEEALLDSLVVCEPSLADSANILLQEHRFCEQKVARLAEMLRSKDLKIRGQDGHSRLISDVLEQLQVFMEIEESVLYPIIEHLPVAPEQSNPNPLNRLQSALDEYKGNPL